MAKGPPHATPESEVRSHATHGACRFHLNTPNSAIGILSHNSVFRWGFKFMEICLSVEKLLFDYASGGQGGTNQHHV